jgi:HAD superfamily hydrolase (TIGR01509 family)
MAKLEALLFDVDGTLADTERDAHRVAFNLAFKDAGLDWDWTVPLYGDLLAVTGGKERIQHYIDRYLHSFSFEGDLSAFIRRLHEAKTDYYKKVLSEGGIALRPGVERLIREARGAGLKLAIATTTTLENVEVLITQTLGTDALAWFEVIAAGDVVPAKKPAPDIYIYAMQRMELDANQCLAFEDSENGIRSTRGANVNTIITVNEYTKAHNFDGAALVIDQLGEPGEPFNVLRGNAGKHSYFDVTLAEEIHQRCNS